MSQYDVWCLAQVHQVGGTVLPLTHQGPPGVGGAGLALAAVLRAGVLVFSNQEAWYWRRGQSLFTAPKNRLYLQMPIVAHSLVNQLKLMESLHTCMCV